MEEERLQDAVTLRPLALSDIDLMMELVNDQRDYPDVSFIPIFSAAQRNNALDKRKHRDKISYNRPYAFLKSTSDISLTSDSFLRRGWFWSVAASIAFLFISVSAYA